uniref:Putative secreted peptide n=1 Tax=Anopheles braziliensis TaxID=58242 RepID=A0A2M3ZP42_9DIPT
MLPPLLLLLLLLLLLPPLLPLLLVLLQRLLPQLAAASVGWMASTVTAVALTVSALLFGFLLSPALLRRFDGAARDRDDEPPPPPPSMVESSSSTSRSPISPSDTSWRCRLDLKCSFR